MAFGNASVFGQLPEYLKGKPIKLSYVRKTHDYYIIANEKHVTVRISNEVEQIPEHLEYRGAKPLATISISIDGKLKEYEAYYNNSELRRILLRLKQRYPELAKVGAFSEDKFIKFE